MISAREASALTYRKGLHRRPIDERRTIVAALEGQLVTVIDDVHRDGTREDRYVGALVGLARPTGAGSSELVIVRTERGDLVAVSSARVSRIEA